MNKYTVPKVCPTEDRVKFINDNAVALVEQLEAKIHRQRLGIITQSKTISSLKAHLRKIKQLFKEWKDIQVYVYHLGTCKSVWKNGDACSCGRDKLEQSKQEALEKLEKFLC